MVIHSILESSGAALDAKRGVVTWKGYDAKASYPYDFAGGILMYGDSVFAGHVTGVKLAGIVSMFRLYNPNSGEHFYTGNAAEKKHLAAVGWRSEGVGWYSAENQGRAPLYREYNPNARAGAHNYTLNRAEDDMLVRVGWRAEGVAWYAVHA